MTIFSKQALYAVELTNADKAIPSINNVLFRADGVTIACNGTTALAVGPVQERISRHVILDPSPEKDDLLIDAESVKNALKNIPRDTKYGGVTEHIDLSKKKWTYNNGEINGKKTFGVSLYNRRYVDYLSIFRRAFQAKCEARVSVNLRRMLDLLKTIDKICPDSAKNTPIFLTFNKEEIVFQCQNKKTQQDLIAVMRNYAGKEAIFPRIAGWQRKLFGIRKCIKRLLRKKSRYAKH